jgi:hypothetical protein
MIFGIVVLLLGFALGFASSWVQGELQRRRGTQRIRAEQRASLPPASPYRLPAPPSTVRRLPSRSSWGITAGHVYGPIPLREADAGLALLSTVLVTLIVLGATRLVASPRRTP